MKQFFLLVVCLLGFIQITAQVPANAIGINPAYLKWNQINTEKVQVVFPQGLETSAQRVANVVHYLDRNHSRSIGDRTKKISIFLQNQPVLSNGLVTVGPYRSEFFMTSPQFNCTTNWLDLLTIHEYRHAMQFGNSDHGLTKVVKTIFGSWAWGGAIGLVLPRWYLEGDATGMETALSNSGRGRLPAFDMEFRSLVLDGVDYGYEKAAAGSFKDFVPDWYALGYYMTTKARTDYGAEIWAAVLDDATAYRGLFYPFGKAFKKRTGITIKDLYQNTYDHLQADWQSVQTAKSDAGQIRNKVQKKTVTNYNHPIWLSDSVLLIEKSAFNQLPAFYRLFPDESEERIAQPGIQLDAPFFSLTYANGKLCWAELGFDVRRSNQNFSIIQILDTKTGTKQKLTSRTRLFSPSLSGDGKRIIALEVNELQVYYLVILDASDGRELRRVELAKKLSFMYPRWIPGQSRLVLVVQKEEGSRLVEYNLNNDKMTGLTPWSNAQITHPFPTEDQIYFSSAYSGINNIFSVDLETKEIRQLTDDRLGAFQPAISPDGKQLAYSAFDRMGYNVKSMDVVLNSGKPFTVNDESSITFFKPLVEQEGGSIIDKVPNDSFEIKKYNKWTGIINPHSWLPLLDPPEVGARILSDNKFSTMSAEAGVFYNTNENEWSYDAGLTYAELFPVLRLNFQRANRAGVIYNFSPVNDSIIHTNFYVENWVEDRFNAGLELTFNFTRGNFFNRMILRADYQYTETKPEDAFNNPSNVRDTIVGQPEQIAQFINSGIFKSPFKRTSFNAVDLRFIFRSFYRQALQHTNPRWGINLDVRYRSILRNFNAEADVLLGRVDLFFPGFSRNHSFFINGMYQREDMLDNYRFSNFFGYPRGYNAFTRDELIKIGVNYRLPLLYPDLALGGMAFVKRVKATVFYDHGILRRHFPFVEGNTLMRSTGVELTFDVRVLRLLEFDFGVRYSYLLDGNLAPDGQQHQFDFLLISITE